MQVVLKVLLHKNTTVRVILCSSLFLCLFSPTTTFAEQFETVEFEKKSASLYNEGKTLFDDYQYEKAIDKFKQVLGIDRKFGKLEDVATVLNSIGEACYEISLYETALAYYDSALVIFEETRVRSRQERTLYNIGQVYETLGDLEEAISHYKGSIEKSESIRKELHQEKLRTSYVEAHSNVYERLINLLVMLECYEEAFDYMERSRSAKLRKTLEGQEIAAYDPSLRRSLERINLLEVQKAELTEKFANKRLDEDDFIEQANELEGKLNQQLLDLKTYHTPLYEIMVPQIQTLGYIQGVIPKSTIILEYISVGDKYVVFIITKDMFLVKSIDETQEKIDSLVVTALTDMKWLVEKGQIDKHYQDLYNLLIKPVEVELDDFLHVVIIPYGILHYVPFHALRRQNESDQLGYFLEWKRISYLPSARFLVGLLEKKEQAKMELLAFANSDGTLPSAEIEVDSIREIFSQLSVYKTEKATKERLISLSGEYRILHLATHGILDPDPRFSYIVLAPPEQGNLTVREILGLSGRFKKTSLVTLSACETAVEEGPAETAGMELTTLSNAFKVAGVPSIIATLWEIADRSTALLMKEFYTGLQMGELDKLEALRQSQIYMLQHPEYAHPYYWAPFILIGDWR